MDEDLEEIVKILPFLCPSVVVAALRGANVSAWSVPPACPTPANPCA